MLITTLNKQNVDLDEENPSLTFAKYFMFLIFPTDNNTVTQLVQNCHVCYSDTF